MKQSNEAARNALRKVFEFAYRHREFLGRNPQRVVLFAEDFDAIEQGATRAQKRAAARFDLARGPSLREH